MRSQRKWTHIVSLKVIKGIIDVPRDLLIDSIIETFDALGLINKKL